ncbi:MAG: hypothetical protein DCC75_02035 [Proteobacteria bacterium]|nr:MAG: hypothetical protein DCC75_02035 [Pseudomonadota bacterium]
MLDVPLCYGGDFLRQARLSDAHKIAVLLKSAIADGSVLPVNEVQIAVEINTYYVYTVEGEIAALGKLTPYGEGAEIGKLVRDKCFQGRGLPNKLVRYMLEIACKQGFAYVFALSIKPRMWNFFEALGFSACQRQALPALWAACYDFTRPSQAYRLMLGQMGKAPSIPSFSGSLKLETDDAISI